MRGVADKDSVACAARLLERASIFLKRRPDEEARKILHDARNVLSGAQCLLAHPEVDRWREHAEAICHRSRSVLTAAREYAEANTLRFLVVESPGPWSADTEPALSTREIAAAIASMKPGATEPPAPVVEAIAEAQRFFPPPSKTGFEERDSEAPTRP